MAGRGCGGTSTQPTFLLTDGPRSSGRPLTVGCSSFVQKQPEFPGLLLDGVIRHAAVEVLAPSHQRTGVPDQGEKALLRRPSTPSGDYVFRQRCCCCLRPICRTPVTTRPASRRSRHADDECSAGSAVERPPPAFAAADEPRATPPGCAGG